MPRSPNEVQVELRASHYAYFVHLLAPDPSTHFSNNYFDLPPGGSALVTVTNPRAPLRQEDIAIQWR